MAVGHMFSQVGVGSMARTGPTLRTPEQSNTSLGTDAQVEPIVATLSRAGELLGCDPARLADAVGAVGLAPWGQHADGAAVWRWPELVAAARDHLGIPVPATRPTLAEYRARVEAKRERQQAKQARQRAKSRKHR
jgi:hypothetical protein